MDFFKLIDVIKCSLNQETFNQPVTTDDYQVLRANQLSGVVYQTIKHQEHIDKGFKEDYYQYVNRDENQKQLIEEIRALFNKNKVDFVFLKGSFLKTIYPQSYMRPMGDIDILIRDRDMNKVHQLLLNNQFKLWIESTNHDCFLKHHMNVEIHPKLDSDFSDEYGDLFLKPWDYVNLYNESEYHLDVAYNYFYQLYHMIKHLYHSGVGFRTLIDLYFMLEDVDSTSDMYKKIYEIFPKKDFVKFIEEIIYILFSENELYDKKSYDRIKKKNEQDFIRYLFVSGTHGIGEDHNLFLGGIAESHKNNEWMFWTKIKFIFSKTFLKYEQMKGMYPYLKKYPILLPYAWIQRFFKLLFKKSSRQKIKRLQVDKKHIESVEQLFKNIGVK